MKLNENKLSFFSRKYMLQKDNYYFKSNGKKYSYKLFSSYNLQKCDIKKTNIDPNLRILKLASSMNLIDSKVIIGDIDGNLYLLISFIEDGEIKVADYIKNIVMKKEDYYKFFTFKEVNSINKADLYKLYVLMNKFHAFDKLYKFLLNYEKIFEKYDDQFHYLLNRYDEDGVNTSNYFMIGNGCDYTFFQKQDLEGYKYLNLQKKIDSFTKNPIKTKGIYCKNDVYFIKNSSIPNLSFKLLSDIIDDNYIKKVLLSNDRYHQCHINSVLVANELNDKYPSIMIVGGKIKTNEIDYFYHSWNEIISENLVIDFNRNLIMNKCDYYELYGAYPISKMSLSEFNRIEDSMRNFNLDGNSILLNYIGKEIAKDLRRNSKILMKDKGENLCLKR